MCNIIKNLTLVAAFVVGGLSVSPSYALDALGNGNGWMSLGVPRYIHISTDGNFYLNGTNEGSCAGVRPTYFRIDMNAAHWKEFYAWLLSMATQNKELDCVVVSGCGTNEVWVRYCRGSLQ